MDSLRLSFMELLCSALVVIKCSSDNKWDVSLEFLNFKLLLKDSHYYKNPSIYVDYYYSTTNRITLPI